MGEDEGKREKGGREGFLQSRLQSLKSTLALCGLKEAEEIEFIEEMRWIEGRVEAVGSCGAGKKRAA
jgi:hypothetical protein